MAADDEGNPLKPVLTDAAGHWAKERQEDQDERDEKLEEKLDEADQQGRGADRA